MMILITMIMEVVVNYLFVVVTHMMNIQFVRIFIPPVSCLVRSALDLCGQSDDTLRLAKWNVHFTAKTSNMTKKDKTCKSIVLLQPCSPITVTGPPWAEEWSTYLEDVSFFWLFNKLFQHVCDPQWVKVPYSPKVKVYSVDLEDWMARLPWPCRSTERVRGLPSRIWQLCSFLNKCIGFFSAMTQPIGEAWKQADKEAVWWHFRQPLFKADVLKM